MPLRLPPGPWAALVGALLIDGLYAFFASPPDVVSFVLLGSLGLVPCVGGALLGRALAGRIALGFPVQLGMGLLALGGLLGGPALGARFVEGALPVDGAPPEPSAFLLPALLNLAALALACLAFGAMHRAREASAGQGAGHP